MSNSQAHQQSLDLPVEDRNENRRTGYAIIAAAWLVVTIAFLAGYLVGGA